MNTNTRKGFTLLELLVVITMMITITTVAVVNYFGAMRAQSYSAVSNDVYSALLMAKQRACIDNKTVYFYLMDETNFVLVAPAGAIWEVSCKGQDSGASNGNIQFMFDKYDGAGLVGQPHFTLVNFDNWGASAEVYECTAKLTDVVSNVCVNASGNMGVYMSPATCFHAVLTGTWEKGNKYGTEIFSRVKLPKGFLFDPNPTTGKNRIIFKPDGTVDTINGLSILVVKEMLVNTETNKLVFTIDQTGKITQGK